MIDEEINIKEFFEKLKVRSGIRKIVKVNYLPFNLWVKELIVEIEKNKMRKDLFERALKIAELTKPKEREIQAVQFWHKNGNVVAFKITLDNGKNFIVYVYL